MLYFLADPRSETSLESSDNEGTVGADNYSGFFEGPEKTIEVKFKTNIGVDDGLRALSRAQIDDLCALARCSILTKTSNSHLDAYVLSESSLFVYKHKYVMKTCGTTTLLRCLNKLLAYADALQMEVHSVVYSRKNLLQPSAQLWPHCSFGDEIKYINDHAKLQDRLHGNGYILGPVTGDHWFIYVADLEPPMSMDALLPFDRKLVRSSSNQSMYSRGSDLQTISDVGDVNAMRDRTLNLMMFGLDPDVCKIFMKANVETGKEMTKKSGISDLCPGATIDETAFTPCGYSMNAILHDCYFTTHITPEESCSYASFETNSVLANYSPLVRNALKVFRPQRFVLTMFGHDSDIRSMHELPTDLRRIELPGVGNFVRTSLSSTKVATDELCLMACYCVEESAPVLKLRSLDSRVSIADQGSETLGSPRESISGGYSRKRAYSMH